MDNNYTNIVVRDQRTALTLRQWVILTALS